MQRRSTRSMKKCLDVEEENMKPVKSSRISRKSNIDDSNSETSDSDQDFVKKKIQTSKKNKRKITDSSSSESDIENYLKPVNELDLDSSFFKNNDLKEDIPSFDKIEKQILSEVKVTRLSDSDTSDDEEESKNVGSKLEIPEVKEESFEKEIKNESFNDGAEIARLNFQKLQDYSKQIEEVKKSVELYQAKQLREENQVKEESVEENVIENLLAIGESKLGKDGMEKERSSGFSVPNVLKDLHSDSEVEDWEEINEGQRNEEESIIPTKELQITVELPSNMKKKKGNDLLAAVKRRLNRIRKENQLLIHKVHLLCWIAHGNYVNNILNDQSMLGLGLSLMPSEKSFPSKRIDLDYLEQILKWYKKTVKLVEKNSLEELSLEELLIEQFSKKEAHTKGMLALIFITILRSLGIQCRLVFSLQVESLKPSASDLHFLGNPSSSKEKEGTNNKLEKEKESKKHGDIEKGKISDKKEEKISIDSERKSKIRSDSSKNNKKILEDDKRKSRYFEGSEKTELKKKKSIGSKEKEKEVVEKLAVKETKTKDKIEKQDKKKDSKMKKIDSTKVRTKSLDSDAKETKRVTRSKLETLPVKPQASGSKEKVLRVELERIDKKQDPPSKKVSSSTSGKRSSRKIQQMDGTDDSIEFKGFKESPKKRSANGSTFENFYTQIYNQVSTSSGKKVDLKKLKVNSSRSSDEDCKSRRHRRSVKNASYVEKKSTESEDDFEDSSPTKKRKLEKPSKRDKVNLQKLKTTKSVDKNEEKRPIKKTLDVKEDIMNLIKGRMKEQKSVDRSRSAKKKKPVQDSETEDSDYIPESTHKNQDSDDEFHINVEAKKRISVQKEVKKIKKKKKSKDVTSRKAISSDSEYTDEEVVIKKEEPTKKKRGCDTWLEVFLEMEEKWISVDVVHGQAHCVNELFNRATHPVSYILAWDNNNHIKDITRRYCQNFNTVTRKLRIDAKWWEESLKPFLGPKNARDREEDDELDRQQQEKPLPTTISEYKNHPLYVLERHLLKFEAIYPPNAAPLGYVRNEPVYSRDCVFVCHSRDIWLKEAKVVKPKEKPYKIVKARPKYDKLSNTMITDQLLEIFGPWQVNDYDPPTAENGTVPRNAFGNVDLFKPSMLPKKCVHLRLPGLNKTAKRLNIDCASAIVGFDFHGGWSHPVYDGFIVCEEYEDELVAAWNMEQEELEKKEQDKYEKRVYGNWKKLIRGLMIRERLKAKYGFGQDKQEDSEDSSEPKEKKSKVIVKKNRRLISDSSDDEDN